MCQEQGPITRPLFLPPSQMFTDFLFLQYYLVTLRVPPWTLKGRLLVKDSIPKIAELSCFY